MRRAALLACLLLLPACAAPKTLPDSFVIERDAYDEAFEATRDVLRAYRFTPDRVDARAGVIATAPKTTAGLATPWDNEQTTFDEELSDLGNDQQRRVRVTFTPVRPEDGGDDPLGAPIPDVRAATGDIEVRVQVFLERIRWPGWRLNAASIDLSTRARDPDLARRDMEPSYVQPIRRDDEYAGRLAASIAKRLGLPPEPPAQREVAPQPDPDAPGPPETPPAG